MTSSKPLLLPDGKTPIPKFEPRSANTLNRTTIFYGPTGTGKSLAMRSFLKRIQPHVSFAMVISPTEPSNKSYTGMIPAPWIHTDMTEKTLKILEDMWERQEMLVALFNMAHDTETLHQIYKHCRDENSDKNLRLIATMRSRLLQKLPKDSFKQRERRDHIKEVTDQLLVKIYRRQIDLSRDKLKSASLSKEQWAVINNLHINPNMVLILDDCAAELKKYMKHDILRKLAYQARHNHITTFIAAQDDTDITAEFRRNAATSLFTSRGTIAVFAGRTTNAFDKGTREILREVVDEVYGRASTDKNYRFVKVVYERNAADKCYFKYFLEDPPAKFRLGSKALWDYAAQIAVNDVEASSSNPYYDVLVGPSS